ncbi:DUF1846 domain-containing protein [Promethearchaeum syntrophicum]|uniref:DUF1846 domain-containing protein n=1 Tax=Promethearchaeum syntrophicum TaxID=2594042 RepID=A0A5B9DFR1_9ARCH|nr:DUF1846 domain-containing protein [Candidatus Prometheoarchaeum syntrophicum]
MEISVGFDNLKYLEEQTKFILERAKQYGNKLYLEFGGKLMFDMHAARVLPGYDPNVKMKLLQQLKDKLDIIICIHAGDIERRKIRADFGISYDQATLKLIDDLRDWGLEICGVVITRYESHPSVIQFKRVLELNNIPVYVHQTIHGYPTNVDHIVSEEGYGANPFIETNKPIVVVSGPGPGSGKMATCLSQVYHEHKRGIKAGYAKFETFPIWNLPLKHPVNIAYEAATADLGDYNEIDPFHLATHKITAVNYNRDVAAFPVLKKILFKIMGDGNMYQSPTDMGVNRAGFAIVDNIAVQKAAKEEIIRRYFSYHSEYAAGRTPKSTTDRINLIMEEVGVSPTDRVIVQPARKAAEKAKKRGKGHSGIFSGAAILLSDGTIVTGKNSPLMHAPSAVIINAIKIIAKIPKKIYLLSPNIMESIGELKESLGKSANVSLNLEETMIALSISAITNPTAKVALDHLKELKNCEMHLTHIPSFGDEAGLRTLGVRLTSDPVYAGKNLFLF